MKWIPWGVLIITTAVSAAPQNSAPTAQTGAQRPGPVSPAPASSSRPAAKTGTARIRGQLLSDVGVPIREADIQLSGEVVRLLELMR